MRHPIQDMYRRHTTGGDDALLRAHGLEEGRRDALAKRPSNPLAALQRLSNLILDIWRCFAAGFTFFTATS